MNKEFSKLCTPAKIYFAIAVIASIIMLFSGVSFIAILIKLIFAFIWSFVLGWLCKKGFTSVSWFLVLLPYIILLLASLKIYHTTQEQKQIIRNLQLQGAYGQEAMTMPTMGAMPAMGAMPTMGAMPSMTTPVDPKKK
uniref:Uncharacterized protein n=1 Tax=viral metagenome TaxID=1070528 RepID=A0A6C0AS17_9ZZZZ